MKLKLTLRFDEILKKFLPDLPPKIGVEIEIEEVQDKLLDESSIYFDGRPHPFY